MCSKAMLWFDVQLSCCNFWVVFHRHDKHILLSPLCPPLAVKVRKNGQQKTYTCNLSCNIAAKRIEWRCCAFYHDRTRQGRHKPSNWFRWNLASLKGSTQNYFTLSLRKFGRNRGELTTPVVFFFKMTKKHLKIGQKYKALLLKEFYQIFSYFQVLSYPKTIYCKCFVLLRSSPNSENCWNFQSLGQNISNAGACFKKRSIPSRRRDFILTLSAKKIFGHSFNYSTGRLQTRRPPQGSSVNFFSL